MSGASVRALIIAWGVALLVTPLPAQAQDDSAPTIGIGFATGWAGKTVTLPVSFMGGSGKSVRRIVVRIPLPKEHAEFVRFEAAALLEGEDAAEVVAQVVDEPDMPSDDSLPGKHPAPAKATRKVLEMRKTSKRDDKPLLDGIIGYVLFRLHAKVDVKKTPEVVLPFEARIFGTPDTAASVPLATAKADAKILVEDRDVPIIACFFYMH